MAGVWGGERDRGVWGWGGKCVGKMGDDRGGGLVLCGAWGRRGRSLSGVGREGWLSGGGVGGGYFDKNSGGSRK